MSWIRVERSSPTPPFMAQVVRFLRRRNPSAYTGQSDQDVARTWRAAIILVGGPTERLVHAFCSPARLWLGR